MEYDHTLNLKPEIPIGYRLSNLTRSLHAKIVGIAYVILIITSLVLQSQSSNSKPLDYVSIILGGLLTLFIQMYLMDCLVYGGCTWFSGAIAFLFLAIVSFLVFMLVWGRDQQTESNNNQIN